jgi:NitT/TauT family transport system permease protein
MALAMIWFGLDGQATVFIICIAGTPVMAVNIKEGFENIDVKLMEMGKVFKFSPMEMIVEIIMPSLKAYFKSGLIIVVGLGWKLVVMGEVLSSGTGLGAQITDARMNLETNKVFAWGIIIIMLCFLSQKIIALILDFKPLRRKNYDFEN